METAQGIERNVVVISKPMASMQLHFGLWSCTAAGSLSSVAEARMAGINAQREVYLFVYKPAPDVPILVPTEPR